LDYWIIEYRDLANERSEIATPEYYEQEARKLAQQFKDQMDIQVLQYDELKAKGLNMLCAVGQGAKCPPRLVLLNYRGNNESEGKSICFIDLIHTKRNSFIT
jgi:leucyl aminopeptidase